MTDYSSYLLIDDLLQLQRPLTPGADDEMLFIVVHQAYELWFKLILHELEGARDRLLAAEPWEASRRIRRATLAEELLVNQLGVLETMSPEGFFRFRDPLAPASGFQSVQFREIEVLSGGVGPSPGAVATYDDDAVARLERRSAEPTLWAATLTAMRQSGLLAGEDEAGGDSGGGGLGADSGGSAGGNSVSPADLAAVEDIYRHHDDPTRAWFHELFERLVDHDEVIARWRYHHMLMAAREIGARPGTGGSLGVAYLERTIGKRFFPVLWEVRSRI